MSKRPHARQRRPPPSVRGWLTASEYAAATLVSPRTVRRWCALGAVLDSKCRRVPVEGGDGKDYRIPLRAIE